MSAAQSPQTPVLDSLLIRSGVRTPHRTGSASIPARSVSNPENPVDFVSFPTLPDPEDDKSQTLTKLFAKTLRRVTNNASNIVKTYSSPKSPASDFNDPLDIESSTPIKSHILTATSKALHPLDDIPRKQIQDKSRQLQEALELETRPSLNESPAAGDLGLGIENDDSDIQLAPSMGEELKEEANTVPPIAVIPASTAETLNSAANGSVKDVDTDVEVPENNEHPKVLSDSKFLRFSSASAPVLQPTTESVTSSVLTVNAMAQEPEVSSPEKKPVSKRSSKKSLLNRISSIFTNLPNDIELSDDSASDTETVKESSPPNDSPSELSHSIAPQSMYSGSVVKSSPTRVYHRENRADSLPSYTSFNNLRQYNMKKKSSNLSVSLIDNARSILNHNFPGNMSSASSIKEKKKKKAKHPSGNPLKTGGIPRKYWMNDAFVSECLNCFKPFTAFRRKHHCRFCGQIFCSSCTLFISYQEHKEQRKSGVINPNKKSYDDKLRVCKSCYSDVIVYLSDTDSSSSESEEEEDNDAVSFETLDRFKDDNLPQHPFARARSRSLSMSRRDHPFEANKSFLKPSLEERKSPLPLSIPATRKGESVEIPIPKGSAGTYFRSSSQEPSASWIKKNPHLRRSTYMYSGMSRSSSLDNLSNLIGGKLSKIKSHTETDLRKSRSGKFEQPGEPKTDDEDDLESENEDEKAMSLYTSLNHGAFGSTGNPAAISPRAPITRPLATVSANAVPTLGEFPTMLVNERLYPKHISSSLRTSPGSAFPKFFSPVEENFGHDSILQRNILQDSPKSNLRSHERAHASLLRMRSRRRAKTARNMQILTLTGKLPALEYNEGANRSPISTPTSPTPGAGSSTYFKEMIHDVYSPLNENSIDEIAKKPSFGSFNLEASSVSPEKQLLDLPSHSGLFDESEKRLETVYLDHFDRMINQCTEDCEIKDNVDRWKDALKRSVAFVNGLKLTDTLDIRQYVKIKKIPGGKIENTEMLDGLIMTKNIDSKRMSSYFDNPKIALLMFPIEYLKQKEQFISLRIVQSQQDVYILNLVSRLISLEPDIIVVGDTVCQLAKEILEEANITVISNTKPQVIERISRYTKADIYQSVNDLFFKKGSLGSCKRFEIKKFSYDNILKTVTCFKGTDEELGFTIVLRGANEETLDQIKYITVNLLNTQINAKFEKNFFEECRLVYHDDNPNDSVSSLSKKLRAIKAKAEDTDPDLLPDETDVFEYISMFLDRPISTSPAVKFTLPTPLVNLVEAFIAYFEFNERNKLLKTCESLDDVEVHLIDELKLNIDIEKMPNKSQDLLRFLKYAGEIKAKTLMNQYQSRTRTWSNYSRLPSYQLYPLFHRSIHLLYSNVSTKFNTPCSGPSIIVIDYYTDNDKFLGLQLDQMTSESLNDCEECGEPMMNHYRNYVHGNGRLDMQVEKYETLPHDHANYANQRTIWSVCKQCNYKTPVTLMSDDTYRYSIGKYFEVAFWGKNVTLDSSCECHHDFFKDHIRYFGYNDMAIKVEYSYIDSYEVVVPKKQTEYDTSIEINLKIEVLETIKNKSAKFFNSITKRLNRVKVDTFDKAEDGAKRIEELKQKVQEQEQSITEELMAIYNLTSPTYHLPMNSIIRKLQELGVSWDADFNDFETNFLPSENEITRITQFHLRNFLIDKYNNDNEKEVEMNDMLKSDYSDKSETEKATEKEAISLLEDGVNNLPDQLSESPQKEIGKLIPKSLELAGQNVGLKVSQFEKNIEDEKNQLTGSRIPSGNGSSSSVVKKPPKTLSSKPSEISLNSIYQLAGLGSKSTTKVSKLTNFFDQMSFDQISMEFKKQRELELKKNLNKFRAIPIVASKPIVEIYNKIEDVVNADEIEGEKGSRRLPRRLTSDSILPKNPELERKPEERPIPEARLKSSDIGERSKREVKPKDEKKDEKSKLLDIPQPERVSLLKSLTNFWADRSASLWDPLEYPLDSSEHTFADSDIIVREDEPSSLVAFCLSTNDYKQKIKSLAQEPDDDSRVVSDEVNNKKINSFAKIEKKFKNIARNSKPNETESIMTKNKSTHLKYQFADGETTLSCKIFYSEQFEALRKSCGREDKFIQSLSRCIKWNSSGGKSKSSFLKTLDNRYIVKELSKSELESFVSLAPFYFKYISQSMFNTLTTALAKIFGIYQIQIKNVVTGKTFHMEFLIMENLFYNNKTTRIFDLKGSMRNRHVTQTGKEDEVLLDENMIEYIYESPLFVKEHLKKLLRGSLFNDSSFLSAMDVMDYSLVIGIDDQTKKLYIGIIDWLRTFTWDKKVENWVKGNNLIGGNKGRDPTIITPKQYRIRFREAMERYILEVPDIWYERHD